MGTKKILFFACLWVIAIGNAQVIRGYDYCHDTLAEKINIRKVARYVKILEKVRDKFFLILLLFIISSCSQKKDPKNNYLFTRIEIQFIDSCIEDVNIVSYEDEEYIKDSVIRTIDFLKDSLYLYHYRKKKGKSYELKEKRQWKNDTFYDSKIFNYIPPKYLENNKHYKFIAPECEKAYLSCNTVLYYNKNKESIRVFWTHPFEVSIDYDKMIEESCYPEIVPFFRIFSDIDYNIMRIRSGEEIGEKRKYFIEGRNEAIKEIIKRYK